MEAETPWWTDLEAAVRSYCTDEHDAPADVRSSVAAVLRLSDAPSVLLMTRVACERDPWSGHVSLPGGRRNDTDADLLATAVRETHEEVGIDLAAGSRLLGRMGAIRTHIGSMDVTPFVFAFEDDATPTPGVEAQDVFWFPLERAATGELDGEYRWRTGTVARPMPCWNYDGRVVWGLTYRILAELMAICGVPPRG